MKFFIVKNFYIELARQIISIDKTVRSNTVQGMKDFTSQSLSTKGKKGGQLNSKMPAFKNAFDLMGDDIVDSCTKNKSLKTAIGSYDEKWLEESKAKLLKEFDADKTASLTKSRTEKQMKN